MGGGQASGVPAGQPAAGAMSPESALAPSATKLAETGCSPGPWNTATPLIPSKVASLLLEEGLGLLFIQKDNSSGWGGGLLSQENAVTDVRTLARWNSRSLLQGRGAGKWSWKGSGLGCVLAAWVVRSQLRLGQHASCPDGSGGWSVVRLVTGTHRADVRGVGPLRPGSQWQR